MTVYEFLLCLQYVHTCIRAYMHMYLRMYVYTHVYRSGSVTESDEAPGFKDFMKPKTSKKRRLPNAPKKQPSTDSYDQSSTYGVCYCVCHSRLCGVCTYV